MDPYKILGVNKDATPEQIKKAYREKARKYHPDAGGDAWAFQQVLEAYEVLTGKRQAKKPKPNSSKSDKNSETGKTAKQERQSSQPNEGKKHDEPEIEIRAKARAKPHKTFFTTQVKVAVSFLGVLFGGLAGIFLGLWIVGALWGIAPFGRGGVQSVANRGELNEPEITQTGSDSSHIPKRDTPIVVKDQHQKELKPEAHAEKSLKPITDEQNESALLPPESTANELTPSEGIAGVEPSIPELPIGKEAELPGSNDKSVTDPATTGVLEHSNSRPSVLSLPLSKEQAVKSQREWASNLGVDVELTNSAGIEFRLIPPGEFLMGNTEIPEDSPHKVTLTTPFYISACEVTQEQYWRVIGSNPSDFKAAKNPVEMISWPMAVEFCKKLSELPVEKENKRIYRLPTEAEWEYACRAGTVTDFCFGSDSKRLYVYAWFAENARERVHPVAQKRANAWGLHDMHGNLWEWCSDLYGPYPVEDVENPTGPNTGEGRVQRGGCWQSKDPSICKSGTRRRFDPSGVYNDFGIRVILEIN